MTKLARYLLVGGIGIASIAGLSALLPRGERTSRGSLGRSRMEFVLYDDNGDGVYDRGTSRLYDPSGAPLGEANAVSQDMLGMRREEYEQALPGLRRGNPVDFRFRFVDASKGER